MFHCEDRVEDVDFLRRQIGKDLPCWLTGSGQPAAERGRARPITALEQDNLTALAAILSTVDSTTRDWERFHHQAVEFHLRNARSWANERTGHDLTAQIDPDFVPGPTALTGS